METTSKKTESASHVRIIEETSAYWRVLFDNPPFNIVDATIFEGLQDLLARMDKITLEEAYASKAGIKRDDKGNPDWTWFMDEQGINRQYIDAVATRLLDFDTTRLQSMEENGIDYIVNSLTTPGIEMILDVKEAQKAATACNDFLASSCCGQSRRGTRRGIQIERSNPR